MDLRARQILLVAVAMVLFASNSLLCRLALRTTVIDPGSFTAIRLVSGALTLWCIVRVRSGVVPVGGSWVSAAALATYAIAFAFAYVRLPAATGALLLFGAVQATMIGYGLWSGDRLRGWQVAGVALAIAGLVGLVLPGLAAPPLAQAVMMAAAGVAWGIYSIRGRRRGDATVATAGNFIRTIPLAVLFALAFTRLPVDASGAAYAVASGALASGVGYALWYAALSGMTATEAATIQLSVPVLAAFGGALLLGEAITARLALSTAAILGGIALVIATGRRRTA